MATPVTFDPKELESKVKAMYRSVAENPYGEFHFEMGRAMAERLGYAPADLDRIPKEAIESFAEAQRARPLLGRCNRIPQLPILLNSDGISRHGCPPT
jgi:hypothetical protein